MQLAHAGDEGLRRLRVGLDAEGGILLGQALERELTDRQAQRFARAYRETGAEAVEGFRKVLLGLLDPAERAVVDKQVRGGR